MNLHIPQGILPKFSFGGINKFNSHITLIRLFNRTGFCSSALFVVVLGLLFFPLAHKINTTEAATFDPAEPTLTLSTSNIDLVFKVTDTEGTFSASTPSTFSVSTNNATGYTLSIASTTNDDTYSKLINTNDHESAINSISSASTPAEFNVNNWGYLPSKLNSASNTLYQPAPTMEGTTIDVTNKANTEANEYSIALGVKANYNTKVGTYANSYVLTAVANKVGYKITYNKNTEDTVTNMPQNQAGQDISTIDNLTIPNTTPERADYIFTGWCDVIPTDNSCSGNTYQPGDTINLNQFTSNNYNLYAMWGRKINDEIVYMQDFANLSDIDKASVIASMTPDTAYTLKDSRDDKIYSVTKLSADGRIWMTSNLNLAGGTEIESTKSNVPEGYTLPTSAGFQEGNRLPASTTTGFNDDTKAFVYNDSTYGGYYSYMAVTAGTNPDTNDYTDVNAPSDICPKGWRLPTNAEYIALTNTYTTGATLAAAPWYGAYGGAYHNGSATSSVGSHGSYWSSTTYGAAYYLFFNSSLAGTDGNNRELGYSARCLAKNPDTIITYNANGGTGTMADQNLGEFGGTLTANTFTRDGYVFTGWNTKADGSGTPYSNSATYTGSSTTLYAQWREPSSITDLTYMQDFAGLSSTAKTNVINSMTNNTAYQLKDSRDNKTYNITKLSADGKVWMTSNLNITGGTTLTPEKSNVTSNYTLPASSTAGFNDNTKAFVYNDSTYGGYYSYVAVTAGTGPNTFANASSDICPKGWRLPTRAEYDNLASTYTTGATLTAAPWYGAYGGYYGDGSADGVGSLGNYWSSTASDKKFAFFITFDSSTAGMVGLSRALGTSARCLAK